MKRYFLPLAFVLLLPLVGYAQTPPVKNPSAVSFTSADHATVTGYEVDIVTQAGAVLTTIVTGKGTQAADGTVTLSLNVQPIAFGVYTLKIRAVAGSVKSVDSVASDTWERVPGPPSKPVVQ